MVMIEQFSSERMIRDTAAVRFARAHSAKNTGVPIYIVSELGTDFMFLITVTNDRETAQSIVNHGGLPWLKLLDGKEVKRMGGVRDVD